MNYSFFFYVYAHVYRVCIYIFVFSLLLCLRHFHLSFPLHLREYIAPLRVRHHLQYFPFTLSSVSRWQVVVDFCVSTLGPTQIRPHNKNGRPALQSIFEYLELITKLNDCLFSDVSRFALVPVYMPIDSTRFYTEYVWFASFLSFFIISTAIDTDAFPVPAGTDALLTLTAQTLTLITGFYMCSDVSGTGDSYLRCGFCRVRVDVWKCVFMLSLAMHSLPVHP